LLSLKVTIIDHNQQLVCAACWAMPHLSRGEEGTLTPLQQPTAARRLQIQAGTAPHLVAAGHHKREALVPLWFARVLLQHTFSRSCLVERTGAAVRLCLQLLQTKHSELG
jgi:hypothetical protein